MKNLTNFSTFLLNYLIFITLITAMLIKSRYKIRKYYYFFIINNNNNNDNNYLLETNLSTYYFNQTNFSIKYGQE